MNGKRRLLFASLATFLVLAALFFLIGERGAQKRSYSRVTTNLQNSWLHNDDVYFYTSSFFAKYNTKTNSIDRLSDYLLIESGVDSVNWLPGSVVFQTNPATSDRDDVTTAAEQLGVNSHAPHWWRYDFQTKQYQLLDFANIDDCFDLVQLDKQRMACTLPQSGTSKSSRLQLLDTSTKSSKTILESDDTISSVGLSGDRLLYIMSGLGGKQSLRSFDIASQKDTELYKADGQLDYYVYGENSVLVNDSPANNKPGAGTAHAHESDDEPVSSKQRVLLIKGRGIVFDKKIKSLPVSFFSDRSNAYVSSLDGSIKSIDAEGIREVVKPAQPSLKNGDFLFMTGQKLYLLHPGGELLSSPATPRGKNSKYPSSFNLKADNDISGNSYIDTSGGGQQDVYIYLPTVSSSQQQLAVGNMLERKGFKPSEFNFGWVPDGVDFHAPIRPNAIIIK